MKKIKYFLKTNTFNSPTDSHNKAFVLLFFRFRFRLTNLEFFTQAKLFN